MPTDTRRISGPDLSHSPYDFTSNSTSSLNLENLCDSRPDGRQARQLRPLFLRSQVVTPARGSGYIEMNKTKVICAVYGPREVTRREDFSLKGQLTCDFKFSPFSCVARRQHQQDNQEKDVSVQMVEALEPAVCLHKYPKSQINLYVTVLQDDGSALSAAILCASVALASAAIEMYDLVVAASTAMYKDLMICDPCSQEEDVILKAKDIQDADAGSMTVAFLPSINQVSAITSDGQLHMDSLTKGMQLCIENCQKVYPVLRQCLLQGLKQKREEETKS